MLSADKDYFANLAVDAVQRLKGSTNLENIQIIKKVGGKLTDSYLDEGFILDKRIGTNCPKRIENARILIANTSMDTDKIKVFGARVRVEGTGKLAELERAEREKMKAKVERIKAHGINCFINRQLIYNYPESILADAGIMSIEHADFEGVERLALVTGGEIASTFDRPDLVKIGACDTIEEIIIGEDRVRSCAPAVPARAADTVSPAVDQVLGCGSRRGVHSRAARRDVADGGRGRALAARRAQRAEPNSQGDAGDARRRLCGDEHEQGGGRGGAPDGGQEGAGDGGVCTCAAAGECARGSRVGAG